MDNNNSIQHLRLLISNGGDINRQDYSGKTPLHTFFRSATSAVLCACNEDIDWGHYDDRGMTIAHYIAYTKSSTKEDMKRALSQNPSHLGHTDRLGRTLLHLAAQRGNLDIIAYLIESDPKRELYAPDTKGLLPLHYATQNSRSKQTIGLLETQGFALDALDGSRRTVMHYAAMYDNLELIQSLLDLGAHEFLMMHDSDGNTPVDLAVAWKATSAIQLLQQWEVLREEYPSQKHLRVMNTSHHSNKMSSKFRHLWPPFIQPWILQLLLCLVIVAAFAVLGSLGYCDTCTHKRCLFTKEDSNSQQQARSIVTTVQ